MPKTVVSQKTVITGKVYDKETGEPLSFVNVVFKNSKIGSSTDLNGKYRIETYYVTDSLICSFVGYKKLSKKVRKDVTQVIDFPMEQSSIELHEFVVKADKKEENPAHKILRRVIANKKVNNREKLNAYQYETYNKIEFDLNNITEEYRNKRVFKPFQFVFDYIDTTESKDFLPLFMVENISDYYFRKNPKSQKEVIKATKVSGVTNESISQFLGDMYQNMNIYNNYVTFFHKSFISPIADFGLFSYRYYLLDSAYLGKNWCYKIRFLPKRKHELTFMGDMWINDTTYAIKQIETTISEDANINFINEFSVEQQYEQVEKEVWMLTKEKLVVDFTLTDNTIGLYGRKTTYYRNFIINEPKEDEFYFGAENIIVKDGANDMDDAYWDSTRYEDLTKQEKDIYAMVDTIKQVPAFRTYYDLIFMFTTGYKEWGNFELGPYFTAYSFNPIEGNRFRIGGRTSNKFSTRIMPELYLAYGTRDNKFKYGGNFIYMLSKKPRMTLGASYKNDIEQLGQSSNAWRHDNIIASIFRRSPNYELNGFEEYSGYYEKEWFQGLSNIFTFKHRTIWPVGDTLEFVHQSSDGSLTEINDITTTELSLYMRFAYKEKYVFYEFERSSLGTKYPIIQLQYTLGLKDVFQSDYDYHRLLLNISDKLQLSPLGYSEFSIEAGKVWGNLPFPLLTLHNGNETYYYDQMAFNLMNYYEFISDEYVSFSLTHRFNGLFLNKIPLLRKLKWREVVSGKAVYGHLNEKSRDILVFPKGLTGLSKPYIEAGVGIENILKIFRIDALWRLSYLDNPRITKFGIRTMFVFQF